MITVFFDTETGGLLEDHPIIQISAGAFDDWREIASFEAKILVNAKECDPEALAMNHYDEAVWEREGIPPRQACSQYQAFLNRFRVIKMVSRKGNPYKVAQSAGYNSEFDTQRVKMLFAKYDMFLPAHPAPLDVKQLAMWAFWGRDAKPESFKLADVYRYFFGKDFEGAHGATADYRACAEVARVILKGNSNGMV